MVAAAREPPTTGYALGTNTRVFWQFLRGPDICCLISSDVPLAIYHCQASLRQYQAGDFSGYRATRSAMGDMARSLERDPQLESLARSGRFRRHRTF